MAKNKILLIVVVIIILAGAAYMYKSQVKNQPVENTQTNNEVQSEVKEFQVDGGNFMFSLKEIKVKQGDKVRIVFNNKEGFHDLLIDEFNVNTGQIKANESRTVEFVADKTGTFEYYCSVGQHRANGMFGKLIVE